MRFLLEEWLVDVAADFTGKCVLIAAGLTILERVLLQERPAFFITAGHRDGGWFGDVARSDTNDNDKVHHHWGQSESGMHNLMRRFVLPGQFVCDPFLGGGTTVLVALALGASFLGCDVDEFAIQTTKARLQVQAEAMRIPCSTASYRKPSYANQYTA